MKRKMKVYQVLTAKVTLNSCFVFCLLITMGCARLSQVKGDSQETKASFRSMPNVIVTPTVAEYKAGVNVLISGSGFEPKQKLRLFVSMGGVSSGIHYLVNPEPVSNELGAFASVWKLEREISGKLIVPLPMVYTISVEDIDGKTLCTAPLLLCDPNAREKMPQCMFLR
jgi:hypothetical protein